MSSKLRASKRDKEEVESEVDTLRSKLRQAKSALEDSEEQVSTLQAQVSKLRSSASSAARKKVLTPLHFFCRK